MLRLGRKIADKLNRPLHEVCLVVHGFAAEARPHHPNQGVDILEAQILQILEESGWNPVFDVAAITSLRWQRPARSVYELAILLKGGGHILRGRRPIQLGGVAV